MTDIQATILEGLNSQQKQAVSCVDGPVLIVAGAGSGKTKVLTSRVAYLIAGGCLPSEILALTFTKKAAGEMKDRIAAMVGERSARMISMGTFHSVFIRFLREFAERLGYPKDFTIYDQSDSQSAVKAIIKELELDDKVYKPRDVCARISMAKNNLVTPAAYARNAEALRRDTDAKRGRTIDIYQKYWEKCRQNGVMDFDDILLNMNILFKTCPDALETIAGRFRYVMVDEYQDTNYAQYLAMKKLCQWHRNICVVGDDSQSIYAFRGAKIENILNFKRDYEGCSIFRLEQNYRSTQNIVNAANSLIARNENRITKVCFSQGDQGEKIRLIQGFTAKEEARQIVYSILDRIRTDRAEYQDFALLYRTNAQSRELEEALRTRNIPYVIYSGNAFYDRAEVKDMMAYLKLAANPNDDESFKRIVNKPARGIGDTSVSALAAAASAHGVSLFSAASQDDLTTFGLKQAGIEKIRAFCKLMSAFTARAAAGEDAYLIATSLAAESGLLAMFRADKSVEGEARTGNVEELLNSIKQFVEQKHSDDFEDMQATQELPEGVELTAADLPVVTLGQYLENISLLSTVDMTSDEEAANRVSLMTVHSSKGLEFPYVYVAGMEENLFPSGGMLATPADIEEERRLFYVAVTRAMKTVTLSFAAERMRNGQYESNSPSRFVREIDRQYIENPLPDGTQARSGHFSGGSFEYDADSEPFDVEGRRDWRKPSPRTPYAGGKSSLGAYPGGRRPGSFPGGSSSGRFPGGSSSGSFPGGSSSGSFPGGGSSGRPAMPSRTSMPSRPARTAPNPNFIPSPVRDLRVGQRVEHDRFGFGKILEFSGDAASLKARIAFDDCGEKTLLLAYAKLRIAD